jgi:hypothetical protein
MSGFERSERFLGVQTLTRNKLSQQSRKGRAAHRIGTAAEYCLYVKASRIAPWMTIIRYRLYRSRPMPGADD